MKDGPVKRSPCTTTSVGQEERSRGHGRLQNSIVRHISRFVCPQSCQRIDIRLRSKADRLWSAERPSVIFVRFLTRLLNRFGLCFVGDINPSGHRSIVGRWGYSRSWGQDETDTFQTSCVLRWWSLFLTSLRSHARVCVRVWACVCVRARACVCVCVCVRAPRCVRVCVCARERERKSLCMYMFMSECMCVCVREQMRLRMPARVRMCRGEGACARVCVRACVRVCVCVCECMRERERLA